MNFMQKLLGRPHAIVALAILAVVAGIAAYRTMPMNLFPDSNRPMISVVTQWPGAEASDVEQDVTHPVETQLSAIDGVRRVTSVSRDQVSAVTVEFEYGNDIDIAATKVLTELKRVESELPAGTHSPVIFRITNAAQPVTVLALTPAGNWGWNGARCVVSPKTSFATGCSASPAWPRWRCSAAINDRHGWTSTAVRWKAITSTCPRWPRPSSPATSPRPRAWCTVTATDFCSP